MIAKTNKPMSDDYRALVYLAGITKDIGVIAGGSVVSIINDLPINDVDLFLKKGITIDKAIDVLRDIACSKAINIRNRSTICDIEVQVATISGVNKYIINIVETVYDNPIDYIAETFDFKNAQVYIDPNSHESVIKGNERYARLPNSIIINKINPNVIHQRIVKYCNKGFTIDDNFTTHEINTQVAAHMLASFMPTYISTDILENNEIGYAGISDARISTVDAHKLIRKVANSVNSAGGIGNVDLPF